MNKLLLLLMAGMVFISVAPVSFAKTHAPKQVEVKKQESRTTGFTGDGVEWWVVEQVVQKIQDFLTNRP